MPVDRYIWGPEAWDELTADGLGIIVDPVVLRIGQLFLEGATRDPTEDERRWRAIESDIGALIAFFDLVVTRRQFPAFNYGDTFDRDLHGDPLGDLVNADGDKVIVHVDIEHHMYRLAKAAALAELEAQISAGPFIPRAVADSIAEATTAIRYEWSPSLEGLDQLLHADDERAVARFLLGQLVFSAYAQQTGAPHVLAPQRSRILAAVGLQAREADESLESEIFDELRRRSKDAGSEWRVERTPWRPSFLPLLVHRAQSRRYKSGPDVLLHDAKDIRESKAMDRYRRLPDDLAAGGPRKTEARRELLAAAGDIANQLDSSVRELTLLKEVAVDVIPTAGAKATGALVGGLVAGPVGAAAAGASASLIADKTLRRSQHRLFGFALDGLDMRKARKLLTRAVLAEFKLRQRLASELHIIWETPRT